MCAFKKKKGGTVNKQRQCRKQTKTFKKILWLISSKSYQKSSSHLIMTGPYFLKKNIPKKEETFWHFLKKIKE